MVNNKRIALLKRWNIISKFYYIFENREINLNRRTIEYFLYSFQIMDHLLNKICYII